MPYWIWFKRMQEEGLEVVKLRAKVLNKRVNLRILAGPMDKHSNKEKSTDL